MNYSCVLGDKSDALRLDEKEGGEWEYVNPPIRDNFRPDPSIRLNFCSNPNPCYSCTLKMFRSWRSDTREPLFNFIAMLSPSPSSFAVTCSPAKVLQHYIGKTTNLTIFKKIFVCKMELPLAGKRRSICMKTKSKTSRFSANRCPSNLIG